MNAIKAAMLILIMSAITALADGTITAPTLGGASKDVTDQLVRYASDQDRTAVLRLILSGSATLLNSGQRVHLVETALFSGLVKVRIQGSIREWWIPIEHYQRD